MKMFEMIPMLCDDLIDAYGELNNLRNSMRAEEKKKLENQCGDRNGGEHQYSWNCERKKGHDGECSPFPDKD